MQTGNMKIKEGGRAMYSKILYATDFDEVGVHAAHKAKQLAKENNAELLMVHVIEPIPAYAYPGFSGFAEVEASIKEQAETSMKKLCGDLGVDSSKSIITLGSTKHEVLRIAEEQGVDLIIAGSHGKHGLALLLGSTANAIMHGAECDVLIVRNTGAK
jgi:universal stress protein A